MSAATAIRERPILMSGPMVRAILDGTKTQTRRVVTDKNAYSQAWRVSEMLLDDPRTFVDTGFSKPPHQQQYLHAPPNAEAIIARMGWKPGDVDPACIYRVWCRYDVGDRLWVKETAYISPPNFVVERDATHPNGRIVQYVASNSDGEAPESYGVKKTPSIFMPRWASRLTLEVTEVRVERLQSITEDDARAEGIAEGIDLMVALKNSLHGTNEPTHTRRAVYATLWDKLNAKRGYPWDSNPWVRCITFSVVPPVGAEP